MKTLLKTTLHSALLCLWLACAQGAIAQTAKEPINDNPLITWINRPWELRYFIYVQANPYWQLTKQRAKEANKQPPKELYFRWEEYFEPTTVIPIAHWDIAKDPTYDKFPEDLAIVVIEFDKDGWVTSPHSYPKPLRGRLDGSFYRVLSAGDGAQDRASRLGQWFIGVNEDTADGVTPALCDGLHDMPPMISFKVQGYIYGKHYKVEDALDTAFACREWSWQMQETERPYIDVTSYVPKKPAWNYPHGTYIHSFVGWSRYDRQKPVIGKHANTWYCLHECPQGNKPGPIADIHAWAKANGWNAPKPPTRMPVFNDDPKRRGSYPK